MDEYGIEELIRAVDFYRRTVREALERMLGAERELNACLAKQDSAPGRSASSGREPLREGSFIRFPCGIIYDYDHGCYLDADGSWIVNMD